ncbi:MAG: hypothetical protein AAGE01_19685 [Pseudomonadota bacterium]
MDSRRIKLKPEDRSPLAKQLERQIETLIEVGDIVDGETFPTPVELSRELRITRLSVSRAYGELMRRGLLAADERGWQARREN